MAEHISRKLGKTFKRRKRQIKQDLKENEKMIVIKNENPESEKKKAPMMKVICGLHLNYGIDSCLSCTDLVNNR